MRRIGVIKSVFIGQFGLSWYLLVGEYEYPFIALVVPMDCTTVGDAGVVDEGGEVSGHIPVDSEAASEVHRVALTISVIATRVLFLQRPPVPVLAMI